jgi:hypothetical protein
MRTFLISMILLIGMIVSCPAYVVPEVNREDIPARPMLAIFTVGANNFMRLHAALYEDGTLLWTEGYRSFASPPGVVSGDDGTTTCTMFRHLLTAQYVDEVRSQILSRKSVPEYGERGYAFEGDAPYQTILFRSDGAHFKLESGHETSLRGFLERTAHPNASPTPVPPAAESFIEDWDSVKNVLFDLVDEHKASSKNLGAVSFHREFVSD